MSEHADAAILLRELLDGIARADALAQNHDRARADREHHAEAAQHADELAEAGRRAALVLIESAFPGVCWSMIERAAL
ncbi:hypothetical protein [Sphingomonas sp. SRS2]|uniref:hypothetical protein n=1 Tax=Sphingomonas sp. SRS2 TaxID=133190 RepID=UPI0006184A30|nr:hypothetical protein [Sphingomonas sp. SRS2]KKC27866.1 hypothetical protein WP12_01480 [Sphingomonas sp. SRS2]